MGFHAPQEAAKVLGEALDYARQGELTAVRLSTIRQVQQGPGMSREDQKSP
jgi:nitrite reductase (cytochrome c-552)